MVLSGNYIVVVKICSCMVLSGNYIVVVKICSCMVLSGNYIVVVKICSCMVLSGNIWRSLNVSINFQSQYPPGRCESKLPEGR